MNNLESFTCTPVPRIPWFYFSFTFVVYNLCHKKKVWNFFSLFDSLVGFFSLKFVSGKGSIDGDYKNSLPEMM